MVPINANFNDLTAGECFGKNKRGSLSGTSLRIKIERSTWVEIDPKGGKSRRCCRAPGKTEGGRAAKEGTMETLVRAIGALSCVMILLSGVVLVRQVTRPKREVELPRGLKSPGLAIEFAKLSEVTDILGQRDADGDSPMRKQIRDGLYADYCFIAMYWLLFAGMSVLLAGRSQPWAPWAAVAAAVCATSAAVFDIVENIHIAALLDAAEIKADMVRNVASAGFGKWLFVSLSTLILSLVFLRRDWLALLGALYFLIAIIGVYGLLRDPRFVEWSFLLNFVGLLVVAVVFSAWPQKVLERL